MKNVNCEWNTSIDYCKWFCAPMSWSNCDDSKKVYVQVFDKHSNIVDQFQTFMNRDACWECSWSVMSVGNIYWSLWAVNCNIWKFDVRSLVMSVYWNQLVSVTGRLLLMDHYLNCPKCISTLHQVLKSLLLAPKFEGLEFWKGNFEGKCDIPFVAKLNLSE